MRAHKSFHATAAIVAGLLLAACHSRPTRLVVGIGLTENAHLAIRLAANEINASGGIRGVPLELLGLDWTGGAQEVYDPALVIEWARRFADTKDLVAVIGHSDSASTLSAVALYNKYGIPNLVTIATNPAITNIGTWTYRLCLSDAAQGPALAEYAVNDWKKRRIAVFYVNDDYGRGLAWLFERRVRELGAAVVGSVMHRNALSDDDKEMIRSEVARMRTGAVPDVIVLFGRVSADEWILRAIRNAGINSDTLGSDNLAQFSFAGLDGGLAEGARVSQFFQLDTENPRSAKFAKDFRALTGKDPDYGQAFAYDAVYLLRDALLEGGSSREGVKSYLDRLITARASVRGVAGAFSFGSDHDARRPLFIAAVRNGGFNIIKTLAVK